QNRKFQVTGVARWFGVPPHMIGHLKPSTSYGTGIAQQALGFLQFHLLDWLVMWETAVRRDLFDATDKSFMEHTVEGLLRADFKTRMEGYQLAIQNGILNPDEVRRLENKPPRADGKGGEYWRPSNMVGAEQTVTPKMPAAVLPGDRPEHAWRTKARAAMRIVGSRDA
ncbi:MAG: phage portal protein, partial [Bacteroidetes bacterium]|nr:phage portal protein [Bacteroidota bacterium]